MKKMKRILTFASIVPIMFLASCNPGKNSSSTGGTSGSGQTSNKPIDVETSFTVSFRGHVYEEDTTGLTLTVGEQDAALIPAMVDVTKTGSFTYASSDESVVTVSATGKLSALKSGSASLTVSLTGGKDKITLGFTVSDAATATGGFSYATESYEEKANILGALEKYAVDNYLTGITIFSNGSQICYNSRYVPQPKSYISGYGWGTTREGVLSAELPNAISGKTKYYNIATTSLPSHANAMNASGSDVSSVYDYIANAYFSTRMNATNDGYEWYPSLSTDGAPIAVEEPTTNSDGTVKTPGAEITSTDPRYNYNKRWRIHVRTGDDAPVYRTNSKDSFSSTYDKKKVVLEDYLTPIKMMLTAWNAQYRGAELTTGTSGFEGAASYYNKTASNNTGDSTALWNDTEWNSDMGSNIYTGTDSKGDFIEFNLLSPCTIFYAMYQLSNTLYSPLPADFIKHWTPATLGKTNSSNTKTPVDTMLSTGPYYIEDWNDQVVNFKKNDVYYHQTDDLTTTVNGQTQHTTRTVYQIPGISYYWVSEASQAKNHFLAGETDSYAPTKDDLAGDFKADSGTTTGGVSWRKYKTLGDSNFKLNVNASTETQWLERFGPTGSIYQHDAGTTSTNSWTKIFDNAATAVKPYMSNVHFLNFLSFAINRQEICESRGMTPTQDYFSDNYLIDPETGISYNSTDAHKAALADRYPETYGYNLSAARSELEKAIDEVISPMAQAGQFKSKSSGANAGTSSNPWVVPIDMEWMNTNDSSDYSDVFTYVKQVFEQVSNEDYDGMFALNIAETKGNSDYNEVYNLMRRGEFDLGFGSISGNALDPINFLEVLKSDNSSGFTLNWGVDTSVLGSGLYTGNDSAKNYVTYNGNKWSFDGLWKAATVGVVVSNDGSVANVQNVSTLSAGQTVYKYNSIDRTSESVTYRLSFATLLQGGATKINISLSNNSSAKATFDLDDFNGTVTTLNDENGYASLAKTETANVYILTINKAFNTAVGSDTTSGTIAAGSDVNTVLLTLGYTAELNNTETALSSTLTLLTYKGVVAALS